MLTIGDVASIEALAKTRMTMVVAGTAAARAAYEAVVTCAWMLAPNDGFERDRRWMALFLDERAYWSRMSEEAKARGDGQPVVDAMEAEVKRIQQIIDQVEPQFDERGLPQIRRLPTVDERLEGIGERGSYLLYKTACQLVHPSTRALAQVRDLVSTHNKKHDEAKHGWRTKPSDWTTAFLLGIHAMRLGLETLGQRLQPTKQLSSEVRQLHDAAVVAVQAMALQGP